MEAKEVPEEAREGWWLYKTEHFEFHSQAELTTSLVRDIARVFEATLKMIVESPWAIDPAPAEGDYYVAELYQNRSYYIQAGAPQNSGGVYSSKDKKFMVPFESLGLKKTGSRYTRDDGYEVGTLIHEITHQTMHYWLGVLPMWFVEGSAEFVEAIPYHYGKYRPERAQANFKQFLYDSYGGTPDLHSVKELFPMGHRRWNEVAQSQPAQLRLYASSCLMVYYFNYLDGEAGGERLNKFLKEVRGLKDRFQAYFSGFDKYRADMKEFMKQPGVVDNGDGTFRFPTTLTPPTPPEAPLPEDKMDNPSLAYLDILLDGRTVEELEADIIEKFAGIGIKLKVHGGAFR